MVETKLPDHIKEYLDISTGNSEFIELFEADDNNIELRTDVSFPEIVVLNALFFNDALLQKKGVPSPYTSVIRHHLRLKVSLDRKSRAEFVDINKRERFENNLDKFNSIANLKKVKE